MKRKLDGVGTVFKQGKVFRSKVKIKTDLTASASQAWRARLNKNKQTSQGIKAAGTEKNIAGTNISNRFQNTASGNTSQKTRKGLRPG